MNSAAQSASSRFARPATFRQAPPGGPGGPAPARPTSAASNRGPASRERPGQRKGSSMGELRQGQQALRVAATNCSKSSRTAVLARTSRASRPGPRPGQQGQGQQGQDDLDQLGRAGEAMGQAESSLGQGNPDSAVDSQGRALEAMRKGAQSFGAIHAALMGQGTGQTGRAGRLSQSRADRQNRSRSAGRCAAATTATTPPCEGAGRDRRAARLHRSSRCASASVTWAVRRRRRVHQAAAWLLKIIFLSSPLKGGAEATFGRHSLIVRTPMRSNQP